MAKATVTLAIYDPGDTETLSKGVLEFKPTIAYNLSLGGHNAEVIPKPFSVVLDGTLQAVQLEATGATWCWKAILRSSGGRTRFFTVPGGSPAIDWADLVDVDPATLDPTAEPEPAWWAALGQFGVTFTPDGNGNYNITYPAYASDGAGNYYIPVGA